MIYFDNAATSRGKPECVLQAYMDYVKDIGVSPGRGSYELAIQASRMLHQSRKAVASFFKSQSKANVVFTKNSTEAINLFLNGFLSPGDHVLISCYEHNAVLRPMQTLKNAGIIDFTVLPEKTIYAPEKDLHSFIRPTTKLAVITYASNLTGQYVYHRNLGMLLHESNIAVMVDASQGAGGGKINMANDYIDYLAFTGHKDLLALPGVGGLCSNEPLTFPPLLQGGTGIHGEEYTNPQIFPEGYEAGTLNMPAIWALKAAIEYIQANTASLRDKASMLMKTLIQGLYTCPKVKVYNPNHERVTTFCFNVEGYSSSDVVQILAENEICVRGGIHCAILAHETLNTVETGAVRISLNHANTIEEVNRFLSVIGGL